MIQLHKPILPMLLSSTDTIPTGDQYIHSVKFDGFRAMVHIDNTRTSVFTRHLNDCTRQFPELQKIQINADNCLIDAELVCLDENSKPDFESAIKRLMTKKKNTIHLLQSTLPCHLVAFDLIFLNNKDISKRPLIERLELLNKIIVPSSVISVCETFDDGELLFKAVQNMALEGIVSKDKNSLYWPDYRSTSTWYKHKAYLYETVDIVGLRKKQFGWALAKDGKYVGVMEFVTPNERKAFYKVAQQIVIKEDREWKWLKPVFQCRVKFQAYSKNQLMRSPSFVEFIML